MVEHDTSGGGNASKTSMLTGLKSFMDRLEIKHRDSEFHKQPREIKLKMSIRTKISVSLFVVVVLILPVIGMTLHYFAQMRKKVDAIAHTDAMLIDLANRIDEAILEAKRAEGNFIFLQDSLYIERNYQATEQILALCDKGQNIVQRELTSFQDIAGQTIRYQSSFVTLVQSLQKRGIRDQIKALRREFTSKFSETITSYQSMLAAAAKEAEGARRDSLLSEADSYLRSFSIDDLIVRLQSHRGSEITLLSQDLNEISEKVRSLANDLEQRGWQQVEQHRQESEILVARAQRNITVVLILTLLVSMYLIFLLPSRIVKPISAITNIIKRVERGDYEVTARSATQDEIGKLAVLLNRMLRQVRSHDRLKTEKILTQQKKVEALANAVQEGVLILNHEQEITLVNRTLERQLGWQGKVIGRPLTEVDTTGNLTKLVQEALNDNADVENRQILMEGSDGESAAFAATIRLLLNERATAFAILIIIHAPPEGKMP